MSFFEISSFVSLISHVHILASRRWRELSGLFDFCWEGWALLPMKTDSFLPDQKSIWMLSSSTAKGKCPSYQLCMQMSMWHSAEDWFNLKLCLLHKPGCFVLIPGSAWQSNRTFRHYMKFRGFPRRASSCFWFTKTTEKSENRSGQLLGSVWRGSMWKRGPQEKPSLISGLNWPSVSCLETLNLCDMFLGRISLYLYLINLIKVFFFFFGNGKEKEFIYMVFLH